MILFGSIIVMLTLVAIAKRYETRMVLCVSGFAMAIAAGNPLGAMDAFAKAMVNAGLVTVICTVMGFSFVMKFTGCDEHLVQLLASGLKKVKFILIPGAILITWFLNIALSSTAGTCAAVGAVLIPTLIKSRLPARIIRRGAGKGGRNGGNRLVYITGIGIFAGCFGHYDRTGKIT